MENTIVTLKKGEGRSFKQGGLWIYDNVHHFPQYQTLSQMALQ